MSRLPRVIAHRGLSARAPENTLAAFRAAAGAGVPWVECDVQLTADGHAVLLHDETLDRTTDGTGRLADTPLAGLRGLDAGGWFDAAFAGESIPALSEALDLLAALGLGVNLEIKSGPGRGPEAARAVLSELGIPSDPTDEDRRRLASWLAIEATASSSSRSSTSSVNIPTWSPISSLATVAYP